MINFKSYLIEGRDAPLYHVTVLPVAEDILSSDTLEWGEAEEKVGDKYIRGVSLTRNLKNNKFIDKYIAKKQDAHLGYVAFEFDQRKLSQRYKIIPFNFWYNAKDGPARYPDNHKLSHRNESEEILVGSIYNVKKYITRIHVSKRALPLIKYYPELSSFPVKVKL